MQNKENSKKSSPDPENYTRQLEKKIEELHKLNEENTRLKNIEKFTAIGRMLRAIAHEIRNPLTNVSLALEQLNSELPHNDDVNLLIDMISRNATRINLLISDLIDSTKFVQLSFSHESINDILKEIVSDAMHFAHHKNAVIETEFAPDLQNLMIDREKIKTAFENLITHAIESVQPNEGHILISTAEENGKCIVTFQNNGIAISEEKIERLFEPHFTSKQGSGLALTYAQNIILNHSGSIYVVSEQGKGTTFTVILDFA